MARAGGNGIVEFREFATRDEASDELCNHLSQVITTAVDMKGESSVVLSGGSTPKTLLQMLSMRRLPWSSVTVVPSDERMVPLDHPDSNEAMISSHLKHDCALEVNVFSYQDMSPDPTVALENINRRLSHLSMPFDAVVLGMGEDGHTASLFPDAPNIEQVLNSEDACVIQEIPRLPNARISLTIKVLLESHGIHLLLFGDEKRQVLEQAIAPGEMAEYPVRGVLHQAAVPVTVWWAA